MFATLVCSQAKLKHETDSLQPGKPDYRAIVYICTLDCIKSWNSNVCPAQYNLCNTTYKNLVKQTCFKKAFFKKRECRIAERGHTGLNLRVRAYKNKLKGRT
jgi:hypothetical protein